jgi:transposase
LSEQTAVVVGTNAAATVSPHLAEQVAALRRQRSEIVVVVVVREKMVDAHPLSPVLTSMPGAGVRTAARLLTEVAGSRSSPAATRRLFWPGPGDPQIGFLDPRRASIPPRQ